MFGIDDATAIAVMPTPEAAGTPGFFTEGNPGLGQAATYLRASFLNALQTELLNILTAAGVTPSKTVYDQLLTGLRSNALITGNATGAANTYAVAYAPAITTLVDGMVLWFKASATNTGASTLNINAIGVKAIVGGAHSALQGGEIVANGRCLVVWNTALNSFVLIECTGASLQVAPATQSGHALQQGQKGSARFAASGSLVVPAGVTTMYVSAIGAGGGGGGGAGGGTGASCGGGGGAGGAGQNVFKQPYTVVPGQTITVTIGTGGNGGALSGGNGNVGTPGGNTAMTNLSGGTVTLAGGGAGGGGTAGTGVTASGGAPGNPGYPIGQYGQDATNGNASGSGGMAGGGPFGCGGGGGRGAAIPSANSPGSNSPNFGGGGGGGGGVYGGSAGFTNGLAGGNGGPGFALFEW